MWENKENVHIVNNVKNSEEKKKKKKSSKREREKRERGETKLPMTLNVLHLDTMTSEKSLCLHVECVWLIDHDRVWKINE